MDKTDIAKRHKSYEKAETGAYFLPLVPICVRIDGRKFSSFTKGLKRPYDERMSACMIATTKYLVEQTHARIGYTQSDEISLVFMQDDLKSQIFFDGRKFKLTSNICSIATVAFYKAMTRLIPEKHHSMPTFDCRVWQVPSQEETINYLIWRQMDATKNSVAMLAQAHFSHKQLHKKTGKMMLDMLHEKGVNWNDEQDFFKCGSFLQRRGNWDTLTDEEYDRIPEEHQDRVVRSYLRKSVVSTRHGTID